MVAPIVHHLSASVAPPAVGCQAKGMFLALVPRGVAVAVPEMSLT